MNSSLLASIVFFLSFVFSTDNLRGGTPPRTKVARQGIYVVKQLVTPDFDLLPLHRKLFAYYLSKAISAGRDIAWTQHSKGGLEIRRLLEGIYAHSEYLSPVQKAALEQYFFKVLRSHGNYDKKKNEKFIPEDLDFKTFLRMAESAEAAAKKKGVILSLVDQAKSLERNIFDLSYRRAYQANAPADLIADTNSNYYGDGVTQADLESLPENLRDHFLSYPYKEGNEVKVELHRINGRFDRELRAVHYYFERAKQFATEEEKTIISAFQKAIETGDPKDDLAAEELWVQYQPVDIDFVIGFKEVYDDRLGKRGAWEGFILLKTQNPETLHRTKQIRSNSNYFEEQMPVNPAYKKAPGFTPPHAEGAYLLFSGGASGETPFSGVNLPNDPSIRERLGSKSFTAINVMNPIGPKDKAEAALENRTFYHPRYWEALSEWNDVLAGDLMVEFHEILGHGSGKNMEGITDLNLKDYYSSLEEARAEIAALYHVLDPKLIELEILPKMTPEAFATFTELVVVDFFTSHIGSYRLLADTTERINQAHQWGRQVILNHLLAGGSLKISYSESGTPLVEITDLAKIRNDLGTLWRDIQEAKSTGNYEMAKSLFETLGVYGDLHRQWRVGINAATAKLNLPKEGAFLNPRFVVKENSDGSPQAVRLSYHRGKGLGVFLDAQLKMAEENERLLKCRDSFKAMAR